MAFQTRNSIFNIIIIQMGNYCCQNSKDQEIKLYKKMSVCSHTTTFSNQNSLEKMKKQSFQILKFLQIKKGNSKNVSYPSIKQIEVVSELGKGGQSKIFQIVMKAEETDSDQKTSQKNLYQGTAAIKRINLNKQKHNINSLKISQKILTENKHPFLINGIFCYENRDYLYSAMEIAQGGDLTSFFQKWRGKGDAFRKLGEYGVKMVLAGIVLGLQYIHNLGLIYCDLKTDNVLIDKQGYPVLTDFELMTDKDKIPCNSFQGTVTSMGPQIFCKEFADKGIDLWALGILVYTLAYSESPFMKQQVLDDNFVDLCKQKENRYHMKRKLISKQLLDLINSLLKVEPRERLGFNSIKEIKDHDFFLNFDWLAYANRQLKNPLKDIVDKFPLKGIRKRNLSVPDLSSLEHLNASTNQLQCLSKLKASV